MLFKSASVINMTLPNNVIFVTRWYCSVLCRKIPTSAKIINSSKWIFLIVKFQMIIYIFPNFHAHSISRSALEDKIQLYLHHTVPGSDQSISIDDSTPWSLCCFYITLFNSSKFSNFSVRSHFLSLATCHFATTLLGGV